MVPIGLFMGENQGQGQQCRYPGWESLTSSQLAEADKILSKQL